MSKKALIVYGTRFGATASTSEEIAKILRNGGLDVRVVDAKKEKVKDISGYDLIIVGSGMMIHRWTKEPEKFQKELAKKKVALFVSSGAQVLIEHDKIFEDFQFGGKITTITADDSHWHDKKKTLKKRLLSTTSNPLRWLYSGVSMITTTCHGGQGKQWKLPSPNWKLPALKKANPASTIPATGTLSEIGLKSWQYNSGYVDYRNVIKKGTYQ